MTATTHLSHEQLVSSINPDPVRPRTSIERSRETDPSTLSVNGLGELQGKDPNSTGRRRGQARCR